MKFKSIAVCTSLREKKTETNIEERVTNIEERVTNIEERVPRFCNVCNQTV